MMQTADYCALCKDHVACDNDGVSRISFYVVLNHRRRPEEDDNNRVQFW